MKKLHGLYEYTEEKAQGLAKIGRDIYTINNKDH